MAIEAHRCEGTDLLQVLGLLGLTLGLLLQQAFWNVLLLLR